MSSGRCRWMSAQKPKPSFQLKHTERGGEREREVRVNVTGNVMRWGKEKEFDFNLRSRPFRPPRLSPSLVSCNTPTSSPQHVVCYCNTAKTISLNGDDGSFSRTTWATESAIEVKPQVMKFGKCFWCFVTMRVSDYRTWSGRLGQELYSLNRAVCWGQWQDSKVGLFLHVWGLVFSCRSGNSGEKWPIKLFSRTCSRIGNLWRLALGGRVLDRVQRATDFCSVTFVHWTDRALWCWLSLILQSDFLGKRFHSDLLTYRCGPVCSSMEAPHLRETTRKY